jgi:hypothetical protein
VASDPYAAFRNLAMNLQTEGVGPDRIVDAMLCVGMNAGCRLGGEDQMIAFLQRMLSIFEARTKGQPRPPITTQ